MRSMALSSLWGVSFLLAAALVGGGCAQDSGAFSWRPLSASERELRSQVQALKDTVWEGTTFTALVGALAGGLAAGAEGGFRGAQIGRLVGAGAGRYVAHQQRLHAERTAVLRAVIADLTIVNAKAEAVLSSMRAVAAQQRQELARLDNIVATERSTRARREAERARTRARENVAVMREGLAAAKVQRTLFGKSRSLLEADDPAGLEPIDEEIATLTGRIANMDTVVRDLSEET